MKYLVLIDTDDYFTELADKIYLNCDINDVELVEVYDEDE